MNIDLATWRNAIWVMRVSCPLALIAAITLGTIAWRQGLYELVVLNAFLAGVNAVLTSIQWFWFKP